MCKKIWISMLLETQNLFFLLEMYEMYAGIYKW